MQAAAAAVLVFVALVALTGGAYAKAHATVTFGTVASLTDNSHGRLSSIAVTTAASTSVSVNVNSRTKLVPMSAAAASAGLAVNDAVWASGGAGKHGFASIVEFGVSPFAIRYSQRTFHGRYVSSSAAASPAMVGTLVIVNAKGKDLTFTTSARTTFRLNGKRVLRPVFRAGERTEVFAKKFTDGTWLALRVDLHDKVAAS